MDAFYRPLLFLRPCQKTQHSPVLTLLVQLAMFLVMCSIAWDCMFILVSLVSLHELRFR